MNESTFRWFFKNVSELYGNVSLLAEYPKYDTATLRKMYPAELELELDLIKCYKMRLINLDVANFDSIFIRVKTKKEFYKDRHTWVKLSAEDSMRVEKEEKLLNTLSDTSNTETRYDSLQSRLKLLQSSSFYELHRNRASKAGPKHMTVLSIFESETMYLIVYYFMMLHGYPHYYVKSDLIQK
ncbi:MAG: hypothetical protein NTW29_14940 [Bacteroidetes bacterium]|nr:hypothetical protein [Bacteroidota bacterium]